MFSNGYIYYNSCSPLSRRVNRRSFTLSSVGFRVVKKYTRSVSYTTAGGEKNEKEKGKKTGTRS